MAHDSSTVNGQHDPSREFGKAAAAPVGDRLPTTILLFTLVAILLVVAVVATLLQIFVAQRTPELTAARLVEAEERWLRQGPRSYDMNLEIRGAQPGRVHIEVRGGQVTAMTRDGKVPPERTWDVWSVPGMFDTLDRELVLAEDPQHEMDVAAGTELQLRCEFDPEYGFPRRYHRYATGGAPEVFWQVTEFQAK